MTLRAAPSILRSHLGLQVLARLQQQALYLYLNQTTASIYGLYDSSIGPVHLLEWG